MTIRNLATVLLACVLAMAVGGCKGKDGGSQPSQGSSATAADFDKIKTGMTVAEVKKTLGEPTHTAAGPDGQVLHYQRGDQMLTVYAKDGKVLMTSREGSPAAGDAPKAAPSPTKTADAKPQSPAANAQAAADFMAKFVQVTDDMSVDDVVKLLGQPQSRYSQGDATVMGWADSQAVVTFKNDKVLGYTSGNSKAPTPDDLSGPFKDVKTGMTVDEVRKAMGAPRSSTGGNGMRSDVWEDSKTNYNVVYKNGKVLSIQSFGK
jgi:outer membrane protein assembly factor BamE (lipoprotein component of BamABCDE complex)